MTLTLMETAAYRRAGEVFEILRGFETRALPRERWTHAAHLTVALWHLLQYEWPSAVERVRDGIRNYNEAHGVANTHERGYHETLTLFWLRHVRAFLARDYNEARPLVALANELIACSGRDLPLEYYSRALLFSHEARARWVEPDLRPLAGDD
jgi:hypothetical protein